MSESPAAVVIRAESPADHESIHHVVAAAFRREAEALLVDRIRDSPGYVAEMSLVAVANSDIVGHVMISRALIRNDAGERPVSLLAPLAVLPDHQGAGVGRALVHAAVATAEAGGEPVVVLEGSPAYYGRLGFEHSVPHGIEIDLPEWAPREAGQVKLLRTFNPNDPTLRGKVVYPSTFDGLG